MKRRIVGRSLLGLLLLCVSLDSPALDAGPIWGQAKIISLKLNWTNADVVALGAALTGELTVGVLPPGSQVIGTYVNITGQATAPATLTVSVGPDTAETTYTVASNAKAAAGTIYGDATAELGSSLAVETGAITSLTASTTIKALFTASGTNLDTTVASAGTIWVTAIKLP